MKIKELARTQNSLQAAILALQTRASLFEKELGSKTILMGFGLDSDAIHSPNEHFGIGNFLKGIETIPYFYQYYTELFQTS